MVENPRPEEAEYTLRNATFRRANAQFVSHRIVVGGDLDEDPEVALAQAEEIVAAGVTHVIDVRQEWNDAAMWSRFPEVAYRWDGIDDAGQLVPASWFESAVGWALDALRASNDTIVMAHCHMGVNRGPSTAYAILLGTGWGPVDGLTAIRAARPIAAMGYAEDALEWHLARSAATPTEQARLRAEVALWRERNPLDVVRTVRQIRDADAAGSSPT